MNNAILEWIAPPALAHDAMMLARFGTVVSARGKLERRIVANLIAHLERAGFTLHSLNDGDELTAVNDAQAAMELVFNLDEVSLRFWRGGASLNQSQEALATDPWHGVLLVLGNEWDIVSDWNYSTGDPDGFNVAMEAFLDVLNAQQERAESGG